MEAWSHKFLTQLLHYPGLAEQFAATEYESDSKNIVMTCEADYSEAINEPTIAWYEGASTAVASAWVSFILLLSCSCRQDVNKTLKLLYSHKIR